MSNPSRSPQVESLVKVLQQWQAIERQSMDDTAAVIEEARSPLVRLVMEIIRHDSLMHHRVQQFLIDSVTEADVPVTREDVAAVWEKIEAHDRMEKKTIELAESLREQAWPPVQKQLLDYLLADERKHDLLLANLEEIKAGMTRASGA